MKLDMYQQMLAVYFVSMLVFAAYSRYALRAWNEAYKKRSRIPFLASWHIEYAFERFVGERPYRPAANEHMLHALAITLCPVVNTAAVIVTAGGLLWDGAGLLFKKVFFGDDNGWRRWLSTSAHRA